MPELTTASALQRPIRPLGRLPPAAELPAPAALLREVEPAFAAAAAAAAPTCGVTRLADVTGLDRIGLPVWQAVRPAARALSVHQGKGPSHAAARLGALCEAIESHCAESASPDGAAAVFESLPEAERAPELSDYCWRRAEAQRIKGPLRWSRGQELSSGRPFHLPHALVSLDYTSGLPSPFDRSSSGLGAGPDIGSAIRTALLEAVERDAFGEWGRRPLRQRVQDQIRLDSVRRSWFQDWRQRLERLGLAVTAYLCPSVPGVPVIACALQGPAEYGGHRAFYGTAAAGDPEVALFKALAEAVQSRLTLISGVRDDILPSAYSQAPSLRRAPAESGTVEWASIKSEQDAPDHIAERLAAAGYPRIAFKRLGEQLAGVAVVKIFVPGLASLTRVRRPA